MTLIIGKREPSWVDVVGSGPFTLSKEIDPDATVLRVESRLYGGSYRVSRYFDERPEVLKDVIKQLTNKAKQKIIDDYGLAGHIEQQLAESQVDLLGRLVSSIHSGAVRDIHDVLIWIHEERAKRDIHRR